MKVEITYAAPCLATIYEKNGDSWTYNFQFATLKEAIEWAEFQIEEAPISFKIEVIFITSPHTGEILAECRPDSENDNADWISISSEEENGWTMEDAIDPDWNYNEDMGYDPYMGCYTDDC